MHLRETLLDAPHQVLIPLALKIWVQATLHQHACAAHLHRLAHSIVNSVEVKDVALGAPGAFHRGVKSAEGAILGAGVGVTDVAVDDGGEGTFRVQRAAESGGFYADTDQ